MKKQIVCGGAPSAIGPYSQAILANGMLFVSGQMGLDVKTNEIPEDISSQTRQVLENVKAIIAEAGGGMDNVVKCSVFLKDMNEFAEMNSVYGEFFSEPYPARVTVEAARLPKDVKVEIEAIAVL
ncbi:MAG: RidA family protein [Clostridiales bacterium]|nr:RidA family protein [Clostridiales bacterium]